MILEVCAVIAVIIFAILAFYIIRTLLLFQRSLQNMNYISSDIDIKLMQLNSTFKAISHVGDICEERTKRIGERMLYSREEHFNKKNEQAEDLADLLLAGLKLGINYIRR